MKLGLVQMAMHDSAAENRKKASAMVREAVALGAEIVCLPELFTSPYFCREAHGANNFAESIPGPTSEFLSRLAQENSVVLVGGSIYEQAGASFFNTSMVFEANGQMLGIYRKTHIPHDDCFFEKHYFSPGDTGFRVFETSKARIAVLICYDQWFPEAARACALLGAQVIFYPTAIGTVEGIAQSEGNWQEAWENVQRGHAIANGTVVAAVNRVGTEGSEPSAGQFGKSKFWGGSFVCSAFGQTLQRAGEGEQVLVQEIDLAHGELVKEGWRFFYNRRPEQYGELTAAAVLVKA